MTDEALLQLESRMLESAKKELLRDGSILPVVMIVTDDGICESIVAGGNIVNVPGEKGDFFRLVKTKVSLLRATAVVFVSDCFIGSLTPEETRRASEVERQLGKCLNVEELHALGLGSKHEAIMVAVQTPLLQRVVYQRYERRRSGREITLGEYSAQSSQAGDVIRGRVFDFFERPGAALQ